MPIGEFFDLEALSKECAATGRYSFFFSSWPLESIETTLGIRDRGRCRLARQPANQPRVWCAAAGADLCTVVKFEIVDQGFKAPFFGRLCFQAFLSFKNSFIDLKGSKLLLLLYTYV